MKYLKIAITLMLMTAILAVGVLSAANKDGKTTDKKSTINVSKMKSNPSKGQVVSTAKLKAKIVKAYPAYKRNLSNRQTKHLTAVKNVSHLTPAQVNAHHINTITNTVKRADLAAKTVRVVSTLRDPADQQLVGSKTTVSRMSPQEIADRKAEIEETKAEQAQLGLEMLKQHPSYTSEEVQAMRSKFTTLSGTLTVGTGGNVTTLHDMGVALSFVPLSGPLTVTLLNASYAEGTVYINANPASSSVNTITIQPATGNTACSINLAYDGVNGGIVLNGTQYVTIEGTAVGQTAGTRNLTLTLNGTTSSSKGAVTIRGAAHNSGVSDCKINGSISGSSATNGVFILGNGTPNVNCFVKDCAITNVFSGVYESAPSVINTENFLNNTDKGTQVTNNLIGADAVGSGAVISMGVRLLNVVGALIDHNQIRGIHFVSGYAAASGSRPAGVRTEGSNNVISNNVIDNISFDFNNGSSTGRVYGIRDQSVLADLSNASSDATDPIMNDLFNGGVSNTFNRISGNSISRLFSSSHAATYMQTGIETFLTRRDSILNNSIDMTGTATTTGTSECMTIWGTELTLSRDIIVNNILANDRTGGGDIIAGELNYGGQAPSDNNVLFSANGTDIYNGSHTNYAFFNQTAADGHSVAANPLFVSASNLHLSNGSAAFEEGRSVIGANPLLIASDLTGKPMQNPPNAGARS